MADIFLSYSRDDQSTARRFAEGFERTGFSVWWDQTLNAGEAYDEVTEKALLEARAVVVLWSSRSVTSRWVRAEATQATRNRTLVPAMIEACTRPIMFELTQTAELSHWKGDANDPAWVAYLATIRRMVDNQAGVAEPSVSLPSAKKARSRSVLIIGALTLLVLAGVTAFLLHRGAERTSPQSATAASMPSAPVTLAVLPFANLSSDREQEYFSDGLTEEILNQLAQVDALSVTARTSSFSFKGKNEDVRSISRQLGVANLLEGSIRKEGRQLRITAQLVSGKDGGHLWSRTYNRELSGVFALQEEIAKDVASALSVRLEVGEASRAKGGTTNLEAWDRYLQAVAQLNKGYTLDSAAQAVKFARDAVTLDPAFARARETLARALGQLVVWKPAFSAALIGESEEVQQGTVRLAPDSIQAFRIRLYQLTRNHHWREAESLIQSADRNQATRGQLAGFQILVGRVREGLPDWQRSCQQDPVSISCSGSLQSLLTTAGLFADAETEYQRSKLLDGGHIESNAVSLVRTSRMGGEPKVILAQFRSLMKDNNLPLTRDTGAIDRIDSLGAARAFLRGIFENPANQQPFRLAVVAYYASAIGDTDLSLEAMRLGVVDKNGSVTNLWAASTPQSRSDPRFKQIMRDVGLIDFFRSSGAWNDFCMPAGKEDFDCR